MAQSSNQSVEREPRAIVHKRILSVAEDAPEASVDAIADQISAATPALVTRVLEEYGDPGAASDPGTTATDDETTPTETMATTDDASKSSETTEEATESTGTGEEAADGSTSATVDSDGTDPAAVDPSDLSAAQIETLREIQRQPTATQQEIADELGVVRATVSNRLRDIEEFDWQRRRSFVETLFDGEEIESVAARDSEPAEASAGEPPKGEPGATTAAEPTNDDGDQPSERETAVETEADGADSQQTGDGTPHTQLAADVRSLDDRIAALERAQERRIAGSDGDRSDGGHDRVEASATVEDPVLLHKAIRALLDDDRIDESEEIRLLRSLL